MSTKKKIAGVAVIVVALALLLGDAMNFTTAVHDAADAQPTSVVKQQVKLRMERLRGKQTIEGLNPAESGKRTIEDLGNG